VDGSTTQVADTVKNRWSILSLDPEAGCGFPVMKLAVLFSLASGAILDVVTGNLHAHDLRLFRSSGRPQERRHSSGDRAYGEYATVAGCSNGRGCHRPVAPRAQSGFSQGRTAG